MALRSRWLGLVLALAVGSAALANVGQPASADTLRVGVSEGWGPPFLLPRAAPGAPRGGLIPDWYAALSRELGQVIEVQLAPASRVKRRAREGRVDLRCFHDPAWEKGRPGEQFIEVPQPGMVIEERLVGPAGAPPVTTLADLRGRHVGTVLGYSYPLLEPGFAAGLFHREDAPAEMNLLEKQREGRTDVAVVRLPTLVWLQRQDPRWHRLEASPYVVSSTVLYCGIRRGGPLTAERLAAAQQRMVESGELEALLKRYGLW